MLINRTAPAPTVSSPVRASRPAAPSGQAPTDGVSLSGTAPAPAPEEASLGRKALALTAAAVVGPLAGLVGYLGGVLYAGTVIAPIAVGINNSGEHPGSLEELAWRGEQPAVGEVLMGTGSMLGSIAREFAAPFTWACQAGRAGFEETYGFISGARP